MNNTKITPDNESIRTQYEMLQSRIALHGGRMWQLPLTYLGTLALSFSVVKDGGSTIPLAYIYLALSILGIIFIYALHGAYEGYSRTADSMNEIEAELGLKTYTKNHPSHSVPYYLLMLFGILSCFVIYIYYSEAPLNPEKIITEQVNQK